MNDPARIARMVFGLAAEGALTGLPFGLWTYKYVIQGIDLFIKKGEMQKKYAAR